MEVLRDEVIDGKRHQIVQYNDSMKLEVDYDRVYTTSQRTSKVQKYTNRKPDREFLKEYLRLTAEWL